MATEQGFSNQKKKGKAQFKTIHSAGSDSFGSISIQKALTKIQTGEFLSSTKEIFGDDGQLKYWELDVSPVIASATVGDVIRIDVPTDDESLKYFEFEIMDTDGSGSVFYVLPIANSMPRGGDEVSFFRWITLTADSTGQANINGTISQEPEGIVIDTSSTPLTGGGIYGTASYDITKYAVIQVGVFANVASATNGVKVEFSPDNVNWDHSHSTTYTASGTGVGYVFNAEYKFMRVRYTNGATPQTTFRIQVILKKEPVKQSLYTISQAITGNMFAELGKNVIVGESTAGGGSFVNVKVNPSGSLAVENTPVPNTGGYTEVTNLNFGAAPTVSLTGVKWARIEADPTNTVAIRWKIGGTATATSGMRLAAGGFAEIFCSGNLSITPEAASTNQKVYITYGT